jgi:signal transduction histidine kinase
MKFITSVLWRVKPIRALLEGWITAGLFLLALLPVIEQAPELVVSSTWLMLATICATIAGFRLSPREGKTIRVISWEITLAILLGLGFTLEILGLLSATGQRGLLAKGSGEEIVAIFFLALSVPAFLAVRVVTWAWSRWDLLRRKRFVWALTHAHLTVVILIAGVLLAAGIIYSIGLSIITPPDIIPPNGTLAFILSRLIIWIYVAFVITIVAAVAGLAFVLPPSLIFSYLVARRMTRRLETLTRATDALRTGDLTARVPVEGEDEVAQLQNNFNSMAADLEKSTQALQTERDKVTALLTSHRRLTANISHELRTPVATIAGYLDSIRQNWGDQPPLTLQHDLGIIAQDIDHLQTLIEDLFTLARADVEQLSLNISSVNLNSLINHRVEAAAPLAWNRSRVQVTAELPAEAPQVLADPTRLDQVLSNLIQNAIRHTPPGGIVMVTAVSEDKNIRLDITDTGEGINPDDLPHIWEMFYHTNDPEHPNVDSAGLGLALVKGLTEAMGGHVAVESKPGEGSRFSLRLPLA